MPIDAHLITAAVTAGVFIFLKEGVPFIYSKIKGSPEASLKLNGGSSGDQSVAFWKLEMQELVKKELEATLAPKLERQVDLLEEIRDNLKDQSKATQELLTSWRVTSGAYPFGNRLRD